MNGVNAAADHSEILWLSIDLDQGYSEIISTQVSLFQGVRIAGVPLVHSHRKTDKKLETEALLLEVLSCGKVKEPLLFCPRAP